MSVAAAALPEAAFAQAPAVAFPSGAIIRTLFKDYAPDELAGGATLFHEHMSLGPDFNARFGAAAAAARAANGLPPLAGRGGGPPTSPPGPDLMRDVDLMSEELAAAKREGVACIVDAGHPDMGRDLNFVRQASMKSGVPDRGGRGLLLAAVLPEGNLHDERGADRAGAHQAGRCRSDRRLRRDRLVGRDHRGRAQGVPRDRQSARRDEHPDLHAHRHSRQIGARTARHPRGCRRETESRRHRPPRESRRHERVRAQGDLQARRVRRLRSAGRKRRRAGRCRW